MSGERLSLFWEQFFFLYVFRRNTTKRIVNHT